MQKQLRVLAISLLAVGLSTPLVAQETESTSPDTVVATVNGQDITLGHLIAARATLPEQYNDVPADELYDGILEQLIQQTALAQRVEDLPAIVGLTLENEERSLKAAHAIESVLLQEITDEEIQAAYDEQYGSIDPQEEYSASHILVETEDEAIAIKEAIDGGADFAATARDKSTGPSGPNGGDLGWFGAGMMVPSFEAATVALEVGQVSDPVETQFGWHVIKLNDKREQPVPALDEVKEQLQAELSNALVREIIEGATEGVTVEIPELEDFDPAVLSQQDFLEQ